MIDKSAQEQHIAGMRVLKRKYCREFAIARQLTVKCSHNVALKYEVMQEACICRTFFQLQGLQPVIKCEVSAFFYQCPLSDYSTTPILISDFGIAGKIYSKDKMLLRGVFVELAAIYSGIHTGDLLLNFIPNIFITVPNLFWNPKRGKLPYTPKDTKTAFILKILMLLF